MVIRILSQMSPSQFLILIGLILTAIVGTALAFEHIGGYIPCDLCLEQRLPYYVGAPVAFLSAILIQFIKPSQIVVKIALLLLLVLMVVSALLGLRHAGVEWGFLEAPSTCGGGGVDASAEGLGNLLGALDANKIVPCDKANWRLFGLSFAGYNALASMMIAIMIFPRFKIPKNQKS